MAEFPQIHTFWPAVSKLQSQCAINNGRECGGLGDPGCSGTIKGGSGAPAILLLHGLGATAGVWAGVQRVLEQRGLGRWIAPDLSGHGRSGAQSNYSVGSLAAELAGLIRDERVYVIGHSLGVYLALALASRWFGVEVRGIVGLGPKISWSQADIQGTRELAARPVRWYATAEEAWNRYRRVSGLDLTIAPGEEWLRRGVTQAEQGWRLSQDPRTFEVAGAPFASLIGGAQAQLVLARGEHDAMVNNVELRQYCQDMHEVAGAGHNAHVEKPAEIVGLLERVLQE
jgi:pimeloyl-ACP methyl ester carboxylesterase